MSALLLEFALPSINLYVRRAIQCDTCHICKKDCFIAQRHNELRDVTGGEHLVELWRNIYIEPALSELTGESLSLCLEITSNEVRLDISARGVCINPQAQCYQNRTLADAYRVNEEEKKQKYSERMLQVNNGTFTLLVFSASGGMVFECSSFYKQLAILIAE